MPYRIEYRPTPGRPPWAKINKETGKVVSRHRSRKLAKASVRAYYATRHMAGNLCCHHLLHEGPDLVMNQAHLLRVDPTRTLGIVRRFIADLRRRMKTLMREVRTFMVDLDALGLQKRTTLLTLVREREFEFTTDANKLTAFNNWFKEQVDANVLSVAPGTDPTKPWTAEYVESSYKKGLFNAYMSTPREGENVGGQTFESFLQSAFNQPETRAKIQFLATRSFEQLKGITATMGSDMNRILAQGMADGSNPRTIAREMQERIGSLTRSRAETIARTEVIHTHAEGQLDAFDKLGVEELGIKAEWSTAGDDRVCPDCGEREGKIFTIDEARGLIPLHPNCRCTWIPTEVKETKEKAAQEPGAGIEARFSTPKGAAVVRPATDEEKKQVEDTLLRAKLSKRRKK